MFKFYNSKYFILHINLSEKNNSEIIATQIQ